MGAKGAGSDGESAEDCTDNENGPGSHGFTAILVLASWNALSSGAMCVRFVSSLILMPLLFCACDVKAPKQLDADSNSPVTNGVPGPKPAPRSERFKVLKKVANGRVEEQEGLRVVHLWGTPAQRGRAHGELFAEEIVKLVRDEFQFRFGRAPNVLRLARGMLPRVASYPEPLQVEMKAMFEAVVASGADLSMPAFKRDVDLNDILLVNALDIFALMACSGFTVWGDQVVGGGVLTTRNFDWLVSGKHIVENCILLVQHPNKGHSHASVTWPGYVMTVTGVSEKGVAVFLHVGSDIELGATHVKGAAALPEVPDEFRPDPPHALARAGTGVGVERHRDVLQFVRLHFHRGIEAKEQAILIVGQVQVPEVNARAAAVAGGIG